MWSRAQLVDAVKYPFSAKTKDIVKWLAFDPNNLDTDLIERGKKRVVCALQTDSIDASTKRTSEKFLIVEILSYPIAKMLVAGTKDSFFIRKYASVEASNFKKNLLSDSMDRILSLAIDLGVEVKNNRVKFSDFLNNSFSESPRLVNSSLKNGWVSFDRTALESVLAGAFEKQLLDSLHSMKEIPTSIELFSAELRKEVSREQITFKDIDFGPVENELFPPCMKCLASLMKSGDPVAHQPRFVLATFLINIGMPIEGIIEMYRSTPNFNENKARYFIEYSAGKRGSGTKYSTPSCDKMFSYGLCNSKDTLCSRIKHPLRYYSAKKQEARRRRLSNKK